MLLFLQKIEDLLELLLRLHVSDDIKQSREEIVLHSVVHKAFDLVGPVNVKDLEKLLR